MNSTWARWLMSRSGKTSSPLMGLLGVHHPGEALHRIDELVHHLEHDPAGRLHGVHRPDDLAHEVGDELVGAGAGLVGHAVEPAVGLRDRKSKSLTSSH